MTIFNTKNLGTKQLGFDWVTFDQFSNSSELFLVTFSGEVEQLQGYILIRSIFRDNSFSGAIRLFADVPETRIVTLPLPELFRESVFLSQRLWQIRYRPFYRLNTVGLPSIGIRIEEIRDDVTQITNDTGIARF
jgi:hypothetical protein